MYFDLNQINRAKVPQGFFEEYLSFKDINLDFVVLFQIGDFYETFFQDAKLFSEITGANLGARSVKNFGEILQAGVPKGSVEFYIKKLLNENVKVCLCNQIEDEKGIYRREITRKYTKGTIVENEFLDSQENNYILAAYVFENVCYMSYADVSTGQFYKTKGDVEHVILEIEKISPNEVLICDLQKEYFKEIISEFNCTILKKKYFSGENIDDTILKYCKEMQKEFLPKLDKIIEYKMESFLLMDEITRRSLELTRTRRLLKKKGSLLWFLNYTKTPMGVRLLKKYLDEPLLNIKQIKNRLEAVEELIFHKNCLDDFEDILKRFSDLSRMCARISNSTIAPKDLFQVVKNSDSLSELCALCDKFDSNLLKVNSRKLTKTLKLAQTIKDAISEESANEITSGGIINDGYNAELDYNRHLLENVYREIEKFEIKERKRLDIEKLRVDHSRVLGYYIEIPSTKQTCVPKEYLRKQVLANCARYASKKLSEYEEKVYNLKYKINQLEYELYCNIRTLAAKFVEIIRSLAQDIARIDVLVSYSRCALINKLTKPKFNTKGVYIHDGFHPSLIKLKNEVIRNDTCLDNGSMIILTGANMSGKSTYLKHNAIICLLSQIGSFVPAGCADLTIIDKIFIRQGSTDDIINNNSSFMVEMNDLKFILDNATNSSFILLDEPAKSTSAKEGGAIARAFCEYLLNHFDSKIILATHNIELTKLERNYSSRVTNYVIGNANEARIEIGDRKIKRGVMSSSLAINTAMLANLPGEIIENARSYIKA